MNRRVGESHPQAKLTDREADLLGAMREKGLGWGTLAKMFDISKSQARRICLGHKRQIAVAWRSAGRRSEGGSYAGPDSPTSN